MPGKKGEKAKGHELNLGPPVDPAKPLFDLPSDPRRQPKQWAEDYLAAEQRVLQPAYPQQPGTAGTAVFDLRTLRALREQRLRERRMRRPGSPSQPRAPRPASAPMGRPASAPPPSPPLGGSPPRSALRSPTRSPPKRPRSLLPPRPMSRGTTRPGSAQPSSSWSPRGQSTRGGASPASPRPALSAALSPRRVAAAPLSFASGSPRRDAAPPPPVISKHEVAALLSAVRPHPDYADNMKVNISGVDLSWLARGRGAAPAVPASMCTLQTLRIGGPPPPGPLTSPRSALVALRSGVAAQDLRPQPLADFEHPGATAREARLKWDHSERRRVAMLDALMVEYEDVCRVVSLSDVVEFIRDYDPDHPSTVEAAGMGRADAGDAAAPKKGTGYLLRRREKAQRLLKKSREQLKVRAAAHLARDDAQLCAEKRRLEEDERRKVEAHTKMLAQAQHLLDAQLRREQRDAAIARQQAEQADRVWEKRCALQAKDSEFAEQLSAFRAGVRSTRAQRVTARREKIQSAIARGAAIDAAKEQRERERQVQKEEAAEERRQQDERRRIAALGAGVKRQQRRQHRREEADRLRDTRRGELLSRWREQDTEQQQREVARDAERERERMDQVLVKEDRRYYVQRRARARDFRNACLLGGIEQKRDRVESAGRLRQEFTVAALREREEHRMEKERVLGEIQRRAERTKIGGTRPASATPAAAAAVY